MGAIGCNEFLDYLDAWMEGERDSAARAHLRHCSHCRGLAEDLEAIRVTGYDLALDDEPPARVWNSLLAQMKREGLVAGDRTLWQRVRAWLGGTFVPVARPAMAGALLTALVAVGFGLSKPIHTRLNQDRWIENTQSSTMPLRDQLNTVEERTVSSLAGYDPAVRDSLHQNLAIVDNYIVLCEKSVREDPENEMARDYLFEAYHQKADLLAEMTERGDESQ
jgi:hypothetical protein